MRDFCDPSMCWNNRIDCDNPECQGGAFCVEVDDIFEDAPDIHEYPKD